MNTSLNRNQIKNNRRKKSNTGTLSHNNILLTYLIIVEPGGIIHLLLHLVDLLVLELDLLLLQCLLPAELELLLHGLVLGLAEPLLGLVELVRERLALPLGGPPLPLVLLLATLDLVPQPLDHRARLVIPPGRHLPVLVQRVLLQLVDLRVVLQALVLERLDLTLEGRVTRSLRLLGTVTRVSHLTLQSLQHLVL